jgi:hypothetical protein
MHLARYFLVLAGFLTVHLACSGQQNDTLPSYLKGKTGLGIRVTDTLPHNDSILRNGHKVSPYAVDSLTRKRHDPRKATIRSAIIPGWGQIYNRKYWKLPLVYAAVGIPAYTYFYNRGWYNKCQNAISLIAHYEALGIPVPPDIVAKIDPVFKDFVTQSDDNDLRTYRNEYRKNEDYSVLFFLLFWGLNVVDATVDAHLMYFDVSDNLSMQLRQPSPGFLSPGNAPAGLSLVFDFHKARSRPLSLR